MALQVWLPLNGTLENKGINQCIFINSGAVINDNGKIGQCYDITNGSIYCPNFSLSNTTFSVFCWVKFTNFANGNNAYMVSLSNEGTTAEEIQFFLGIYKASANDYAQISINLGSNKFGQLYTDTWYHIGLTCQNNTVLIYLNGQYIGTRNISAYAQQHLVIGGRSSNSSSTSFAGRPRAVINDVRIYDHVLSSLEVKEIAQGLILHYKMDDNINILNNCYSSPTFNTSNANGGWGHWGGTGHSGHYGQNTDKQYIYNKNNTYSHWISDDATATARYLCYQSPAFDGGYRSLQAIIKEENGLPISEAIIVPSWNGRNGGVPNNEWTSIIPLEDNFYLCKCEGISQDGSNNLIGFNVYPGYKVYISEAYCENDTQICSNILPLFQQDKIIDSSGYNHHGTIVGNVQTVIDKKSRYEKCIYIPSNDLSNNATDEYYISTDCGLITPSELSVSWWSYPEASYNITTTIINGMWCTTALNVGSDYQVSAFNHRDTRFDVNSSDGVHLALNTSSIKGNEWHYYVVVYDGQVAKLYKDTVLQTSVSFTEPKTLGSFTKILIGHSRAGSVHRKVRGKYSDFRVYVTALDDNAIKNLYNIGMKIDNLNNIHTFEYKEQNDANIKLYKTGQLLTDEINEISGNTQFKKTGQIYASEFIER